MTESQTPLPVTETTAIATPRRAFPQLLFALNAIFAWTGVIIGTITSGFHMYDYTYTDPHVFGANTSAVGRLIDDYSYFTIWSNLLVAIVMTILAVKPEPHGVIMRVLRLDSVVMITVTGILYWALLAANSQSQGIDRIGTLFDHTLTPILTVVVWLLVGPRNWIRWWTPFAALIIPIVWAAYTLVRGNIVGVYPYPFLNVDKYGLPAVLTTIGMIAVFGLVLGYVCWGLDLLLGRKARAAASATAAA